MIMKKYKVPVEWAMSGYLVVDAANPTEAIEKARDMADTCPLPEGEYIDGSFMINSDEGQPAEELSSLLTDVYLSLEEI